MRALKILVGLLLLPACAALAITVARLAWSLRSGGLGGHPWALGGLGAGFALWVLVFLALPRPTRSYVLAHELTHAAWGLLWGARVSGLRVRGESGQVRLSKTNFAIALAPYFFPLYTVLVIAAYGILSLFFDLRTYEPFWTGLVGLSWGFHATFTLATLATRQSDVLEHGRLFSGAVILAANLLGVALWIVAVGSPTLGQFARALAGDLAAVLRALAGLAQPLRDAVRPGG
jgi:hypothetical protein